MPAAASRALQAIRERQGKKTRRIFVSESDCEKRGEREVEREGRNQEACVRSYRASKSVYVNKKREKEETRKREKKESNRKQRWLGSTHSASKSVCVNVP